ncbi:MAG: hypothetical protein WAL09_04915, partial [Pseudolabrys sp.]
MRRNKKKMKALAPKSAAGILFCACLVFSFSADAFDLNGTWTTDDSNCNRVFVKKNIKISLTRNADVFGGRFIVEGNQIRGQARACKITNRKEESGVLHLIASCSTDIAV